MILRIVVIAGCIDAAWIPLYALFGSPILAWMNLVSVTMYASAYVLIKHRRNVAGLTLIWVEVLSHAAIGSLLVGWESGFHYFLLLFIPAIVVGSVRRQAILLVLAVLAFYLALDAACAAFAPLTPLSAVGFRLAKWINITLIFGMFFSMASLYRSIVLKAEQRLLAQANTDPLTGLANRSHFQSRAAVELARSSRTGEPVTLILADIDFFKRINDRFGHDVGDKVLVEIAALMTAKLREVDVLARWGGEEFLVLLPDSDEASALGVAERVRKGVQDACIESDGQRIAVTMSFGVTQVHAEDDLQAAIVRADQALYRSKESGRNKVSCAAVRPGVLHRVG